MSVIYSNGDNQGPISPIYPSNNREISLGIKSREERALCSVRPFRLNDVENKIQNMEHTDLKKLHLYKVSLTILMVVMIAILFTPPPIAIMFNVPFGIPLVIGFGIEVLSIVVSYKLRVHCEEICSKYRALQVYRTLLVDRYADLSSSSKRKNQSNQGIFLRRKNAVIKV